MSQYDDFNHCETVYIANMVVNLCSAIGKALGNPQVPSSNTAGAFVFIDRSKFQKLIFSTNLNLNFFCHFQIEHMLEFHICKEY